MAEYTTKKEAEMDNSNSHLPSYFCSTSVLYFSEDRFQRDFRTFLCRTVSISAPVTMTGNQEKEEENSAFVSQRIHESIVVVKDIASSCESLSGIKLSQFADNIRIKYASRLPYNDLTKKLINHPCVFQVEEFIGSFDGNLEVSFDLGRLDQHFIFFDRYYLIFLLIDVHYLFLQFSAFHVSLSYSVASVDIVWPMDARISYIKKT